MSPEILERAVEDAIECGLLDSWRPASAGPHDEAYNSIVRLPGFVLALAPLAFLAFAAPTMGQGLADRPQAIFSRAVDDFERGRIAESVEGFDTVAKLVPDLAPQLWQRGIALYYAGRYKDCRAQFESHRTVNPNDVENAAWHFLCVARGESVQNARAALLPVGPDSRVPMRQVYEMFRGALKPEDVMAAAGDRPAAQFYAHLYVGLYLEATGNKAAALEHITAAASDQYASAGYMHIVAKTHLALLRR
jgi:lipoprotein NlpI